MRVHHANENTCNDCDMAGLVQSRIPGRDQFMFSRRIRSMTLTVMDAGKEVLEYRASEG